ncbi:MAG: hypothetical protein IH906_07945 [Proteobacteria bacterium]|nr:hypothetical protein [Pseudomonadota bacterium]
MSESSQLTQLLKITSVAGVFVSLILGAISVVWIIFGATAEELPVLIWGTLFVALPLFGTLYVTLKLREYLRDILAALSKSD